MVGSCVLEITYYNVAVFPWPLQIKWNSHIKKMASFVVIYFCFCCCCCFCLFVCLFVVVFHVTAVLWNRNQNFFGAYYSSYFSYGDLRYTFSILRVHISY